MLWSICRRIPTDQEAHRMLEKLRNHYPRLTADKKLKSTKVKGFAWVVEKQPRAQMRVLVLLAVSSFSRFFYPNQVSLPQDIW